MREPFFTGFLKLLPIARCAILLTAFLRCCPGSGSRREPVEYAGNFLVLTDSVANTKKWNADDADLTD